MAVYFHLDSSNRSNPYIQKADSRWYPNDYRYASGQQVQTPTNYRVFYPELNASNNSRTISFLEHCKERVQNITFSVEFCTVIIPAAAQLRRFDCTVPPNGAVTYTNLLNEPYIFVRLMPIENSEGDLIYSNNPPADEATFVCWLDKYLIGPLDAGTTVNPTSTLPDTAHAYPIEPPPLASDPNPQTTQVDLPSTLTNGITRFLVFKSCIAMPMRLNLESQEWQIRLFDRYGNDIIIVESDTNTCVTPSVLGFETPPPIDPALQTMLIVGIRPNYPL